MSTKNTKPVHAHIRRADDIAALIKARREELGLSQDELADRLTLSRKWVNEIEQGNSNARLGLVLRTLNELEISLVAQNPERDQTQEPVSTKADEINIDAIADTGLVIRQHKKPVRRGKR